MPRSVLRSIPISGILVFATALLAASGLGQDTPAPDRTVWEGVYSSEQADRGMEVYSDQCAQCHAANMMGGPGAPGLAGPEFMFGWNGSTLGELFDLLQTSMPPGSDTLSDSEYVGLIATILRRNSFPEGGEELGADLDLLSGISILREAP